jgi:hypothetical protein
MRRYFELKVMPILDKLVAPGSKFEGYTPILQGDNAPGHAEGTFSAWLEAEFERRNWHIENQAPQSPYTNVCDLAIFPAMAKRHTHLLLERHGNVVPKPDDMWHAALEIWNGLDSCTIARSFIQGKRVHDMIVEDGGKQAWLSSGGPHCNCRKDFKNGVDRVSVWPSVPGQKPNVKDWLPFRQKKMRGRRCKSKQ